MSNRSNGPKNIVEVLNIVSDQNPYTGERFYRVDIGTQVPIPKVMSATMNPFPQPLTYFRSSLTLYMQGSEWTNQYQAGQKYELVIKEKGELTLKPLPL